MEGRCIQNHVFQRIPSMQSTIHPPYTATHVACTCGNEFHTRSVAQGDIKVEICSNCHPFYTGKTRSASAGGRIDRFKRRAALREKQ